MFKFKDSKSSKVSKNQKYDSGILSFKSQDVLINRKDNNSLPDVWNEYTFDPHSKYFIQTGRKLSNLKKISFHPHNKGNINQRLINISFADINGEVSITSFGENGSKSPLMSVIRKVNTEYLMFNLI